MELGSRGHAVVLQAKVGGVPVQLGDGIYGMLPFAAPMDGVHAVWAAHRNGPGIGYLRSQSEGAPTLAWKAPAAADYGTPQAVFDTMFVIIPGSQADQWAIAFVHFASLIRAGQEFPVYLENRYNIGLADSDIAAADALAGITVDTELEFLSLWLLPIYNLAVWLDPAAAFASIRLGGSGPFTSPTSEATAIGVPILAAGATLRLDIRRTIPPATPSNPRAISWIHYRFDL